MELVMSTGRIGEDSNSYSSSSSNSYNEGPFRNEEVKEWSRVDRITGMIERARVETGRWRANTKNAEHSYGKMSDLRERNSADGNLIQKGCRQVEIFQSQGTGGRSIQVIKASQWASSRSKENGIDVPDFRQNFIPFNNGINNAVTNGISNELNNQIINDEFTNGITNNEIVNVNDDFRNKMDLFNFRGHSELERLSNICKKLHDEAMNNIWTLRNRNSSTLMLPKFEKFGLFDDEKLSITDKRSNSSEDLPSLVHSSSNPPSSFTRDSRIRRSLQIPKSFERRIPISHEFSPRFIEDSNRFKNNISKPQQYNHELDERNFSDSSSSNEQDDQLSPLRNEIRNNTSNVSHSVNSSSDDQDEREQKLREDWSDYFKKKNNNTVVHLKNAASPTNTDENDSNRCNVIRSSMNGIPKETSKPQKRVEFSKTEIHFAPDSGKVNIIETDGKPPPTNKFRRRKRISQNNNSNNNVNNNTKNSNSNNNNNKPLVHFGDTSYEKYIFGGGKEPKDEKKLLSNNDSNDKIDSDITNNKITRRLVSLNDLPVNENSIFHNRYLNDGLSSGVKNDNSQQYKGHTTKINILNEDNDQNFDTDNLHNRFFYNHRDRFNLHNEDWFSRNKDENLSNNINKNEGIFNATVPTYKPITSKIENIHPSAWKLRLNDEMTKDRYDDNINKKYESDVKSLDTPLYENIFDAVTKDTPTYENLKIMKTDLFGNDKNKTLSNNDDKKVKQLTKPNEKKEILKKKKPIEVASDDKNNKTSKVRITRSITPNSTLSSSKSDKNVKSSIPKRLTDTRNNLLNSSKNNKDLVKESTLKKTTPLKSKVVNNKIIGIKKESTPEKQNNSVRTKKPVEVVYKTAVYNMKNEKLANPSKEKEPAKGPRLINDLIFGSKTKKPSSDNKKTVKTALLQKNTKPVKPIKKATATNR